MFAYVLFFPFYSFYISVLLTFTVSFVIFLLFISAPCTLVAICQLEFLYEYMDMDMVILVMIISTMGRDGEMPSSRLSTRMVNLVQPVSVSW